MWTSNQIQQTSFFFSHLFFLSIYIYKRMNGRTHNITVALMHNTWMIGGYKKQLNQMPHNASRLESIFDIWNERELDQKKKWKGSK